MFWLGAGLGGAFLACFTTTSSSFFAKLLFPSYILLIPAVVLKDGQGYATALLVFLGSFGPLGIKKHFLHDPHFGIYTTIDLMDWLSVGIFIAGWLRATACRAPQGISQTTRGSLLLFIGLALSATFIAHDKTIASFQTATLLRNILIFYVLADQINSEARLRFVLLVLLAGAAVQSGLAIAQEFFPHRLGLSYFAIRGDGVYQELDKVGVFRRVSGTFPSHNVFSFAYLDFILPVLASVPFLVRSIIRKVIASGVFGLALMALVFTLSRGGWISFIVSMSCFILIGRRARLFHQRHNLILWLFVGSLFLGLIFSWEIILSRFVSYDQGAASIRLSLMRVALDMISDNPWFGVGPGNYVYAMGYYDSTLEGVTSYFKFPVHNLFLYVAGEMGLPALFCFLVFLFFVARAGLDTIYRQQGVTSLLSLGVLSGLAGGLFHGLSEYQPLGQMFMLWCMAGLLVGLNRLSLLPRHGNG
ncbi:MAG: O-antigen ligase family protein [Elusimicrobia bacterium]|nr:O-antigen ligase family protein [Elusimicrobiota bacterium]